MKPETATKKIGRFSKPHWVGSSRIFLFAINDLTRFSPQNVAFWKGNPRISGKSRLVKYYNLTRINVEIHFMSPFNVEIHFMSLKSRFANVFRLQPERRAPFHRQELCFPHDFLTSTKGISLDAKRFTKIPRFLPHFSCRKRQGDPSNLNEIYYFP